MSHATTAQEPKTVPPEDAAGSAEAALRWLTLTDQRVASELGRALLQVHEGRLYEKEGHARWLTYVRAFVGRTLRWAQFELRRERELKSYPRLAQAFRLGVLSRSRLRVILGVVTPFTEELWLVRGLRMTVRQLEAEAARARARDDAPNKDADEQIASTVRHQVAAPPGVAALVGEAVDLARRLAGYQVGTGEAVWMLAAETLSAVAAHSESFSPDAAIEWRDRAPASKVENAAWSNPEAGAAHDCEWAEAHRFLEQLLGQDGALPGSLTGLLCEPAPAPDAPAHHRVVFWAAAQRRLDAVRGRLLRVVREARLGRSLAPPGVDRLAAGLLGLSPREAQELIRLDQALSRRPVAFRMYAAGRLSRSAAWLVAKAATSARGDRAWTRWALTHSLRSLEAAVEAALPGPHGSDGPLPPIESSFADLTRMCSPAASPGAGSARIRFSMTEEDESAYRMALSALRGLYGSDRPEWWCLAVMARHFLDVHADSDGRVRRTLARRVVQRDNYTCTAPECLQRAGLEAHHIHFRSAGGSDALDNLTSLCAAHHRRIQHEVGGMKLQGRAPADITVRMGDLVYRGDRLIAGVRDPGYGRRSRDSMRRISRIWAGVTALRTASMMPGAFTR